MSVPSKSKSSLTAAEESKIYSGDYVEAIVSEDGQKLIGMASYRSIGFGYWCGNVLADVIDCGAYWLTNEDDLPHPSMRMIVRTTLNGLGVAVFSHDQIFPGERYTDLQGVISEVRWLYTRFKKASSTGIVH
jgi:hypothetical protein